MARPFDWYDGEEVELPHPGIPCAWCGRLNMDWNACPNAKDICNYCCGEEEEYVDYWRIVKVRASAELAVADYLNNAAQFFLYVQYPTFKSYSVFLTLISRAFWT